MSEPVPTFEKYRIRPAAPADVTALHDLVVELAVYEREPDAVETSVDEMAATFFPAAGEPLAPLSRSGEM